MKSTQKHQSTPPQNSMNKLRRQDAIEAQPIEDSSDDLMDSTTLSTDAKLDLILKSTQSNRRDTRRMTKTIRSLETEFASSSTRMDNMEQQITQLQQDIQQIKMDPLNKTDPPSRRSSVDSTTSGPPITPELMAKKMRTLYFRGFPIDTKHNILQWMNQHDIANVEDTYTLGHLSDTAVVIFKDESSLWTFLRQCPNNKWHVYGSSQIYVGLDNQLRGQHPEETSLFVSYIVPVFKFFLPNTRTKIFLKLMSTVTIIGVLLKSLMVQIGRMLLIGIHELINLFSQRTIQNTNQLGGHLCADYVLLLTFLYTIHTFTGITAILLAKPLIRALALLWRASTSHLLHFTTKNYFITMLFWCKNRGLLFRTTIYADAPT